MTIGTVPVGLLSPFSFDREAVMEKMSDADIILNLKLAVGSMATVTIESVKDRNRAQEKVKKLLIIMREIRDLARTGSIPSAMNMTEEQWAIHKINRIAGMADLALQSERVLLEEIDGDK
jgi:hypothetical protein